MKSIFPRQAFAQSLRRCLERFPAAAGFIAALTALLLVQSWGDKCVPDRLFSTGLYYLSVGGLLSLVLRLWSEETENRRTVLAAKVAGHTALLIDAAYLYDLPAGAIGMEAILMHASLVTALALSVCILPFLREKDDIASWNFAWELTGHLISSCLVGLLMFGGLSLLTASLSGLFGLDVDSRWYLTWCTVCLLFLSLLLFLGRIPAGEGKHDRMAYTPPFVQKTIRYLFLPLMGCYLLVLYAYLAKILTQWELPDGWVARLVTALMGGCIAVEFCLYPLLRQGAPQFERRVARWLPVAILPLLVLMTVGIARRIGDYGYTVNRLYLLALNLWFYLVCGGLFLSRKRIRWIPVSFAAIFLLTSVLPWNLTSVSRRYLLRSVDEVFRTSCKKPLPLSDEDYLDWLRTLPRQEALNTNDRLRYLAEEMDEPAVARFISPDIYFWGIRNAISEPEKYTYTKGKDGRIQVVVKDIRNYSTSSIRPFTLPIEEGYKAMRLYENQECDIRPCGKDGEWWAITCRDSLMADTLYVRPDSLRQWGSGEAFTPRELSTHNQGNRFIMTGFNLYDNPVDSFRHFALWGYYLMK